MPNDPFIGKNINGYVIEERIGEGGLGAVYKGIKAELDDVRAVKFVPLDGGLI